MEGTEDGAARPATFRDPDLQAAFERDGYVITPLLSLDQCEDARARVAGLIPADSAPFYGPFRASDSPATRRSIDEVVRPLLGDALGAVLADQTFWMGALMVKHPGSDGYLGLHHDDTRVDEERFTGAIAWVPLDDSDAERGGLFVVAGSHRLDAPRRGSPRGVREISDVEDLLVERYLTHLTVPAGHVVVYDNRLVHGSNTNQGDDLRIALAVGLIPAEADLVYFVDSPDGETLRYVVRDEYFLDMVPPLDWGAADSSWRPPVGGDVLAVASVGPIRHPLLDVDDLSVLTPTGPPRPAAAPLADLDPPADPEAAGGGGVATRSRSRRSTLARFVPRRRR